jgi:hypothetical protein
MAHTCSVFAINRRCIATRRGNVGIVFTCSTTGPIRTAIVAMYLPRLGRWVTWGDYFGLWSTITSTIRIATNKNLSTTTVLSFARAFLGKLSIERSRFILSERSFITPSSLGLPDGEDARSVNWCFNRSSQKAKNIANAIVKK